MYMRAERGCFMPKPVTACGRCLFACSMMLSSYNQRGSTYPTLLRAAVRKMSETDVCCSAGSCALHLTFGCPPVVNPCCFAYLWDLGKVIQMRFLAASLPSVDKDMQDQDEISQEGCFSTESLTRWLSGIIRQRPHGCLRSKIAGF